MKTLEDVLEEITPTPDPDFVADMEWRMRQGFPSQQRKRRLPQIDLARLHPRHIAAVTASAGLAAVVAVALIGSDGEQPITPAQEQFEAASGGGGGDAVTSEAAPARTPHIRDRRALSAETDAAATDELIAPPGGGGGVAPGAQVRRIERSAGITLASDPAEFDNVSDEIFRTVARRDGFVLQSSFTQGEDGLSSGFFELRVPSTQLQQTLNDLSGLATVRSRSESGTDVTAPFVSTRDRLRTAKALRTSLLNRLEVAFTDTAVDALRRRLNIVGNRITRLREDLRGMRERTEFATVMVELVDEDAGAVTGETDEAFDDAVGSLEDILNFLIRAVGVLLPLGLVAGIAWFVAVRARRRARERTLA
jgi:hypothetical protein